MIPGNFYYVLTILFLCISSTFSLREQSKRFVYDQKNIKKITRPQRFTIYPSKESVIEFLTFNSSTRDLKVGWCCDYDC